jgi:RNA polymerase sigma factor (sigma-70 family)
MAVVISDRLLDGSGRLLDAEPDDRLVSLVQAGSEVAFAAIVRRYEGELQVQARRLGSDGRAEDAVQQAFLNAFAALQGGKEVRHLRGWLHRILRNEIMRARIPVETPLEVDAVYGESLEDMVQTRAAARATLVQLSALPDRQRDALLGTAVFGLTRADVARTMGLSEGAVRQLVHRARLRLRQAASALIPFPLVRMFGAARSGVDAAPDAAIGAGTAASGGLVVKVGALVVSGVVATGVAVTHGFPSHDGAGAHARAARHHPVRTHTIRRVSPPAGVEVTTGAPLSVSAGLPSRAGGSELAGSDRRPHGALAGLSPGRSHGHSGPGSGPGRDDGVRLGGSSDGRGDDGSGRSQGGTVGLSHDGASGSRSGAGSSDGMDGSGRVSSGSATGSGSGQASDSGSGSVSGSDSSSSSSDGVGSSSGGTSGDGGGGSDGSEQYSGGSRDVSGSHDSSSS